MDAFITVVKGFSLKNSMKGRTLIAQLPEQVGKVVTIAGWVHQVRDLGKIAFLMLRDRSGVVQCVLEGDMYTKLAQVNLESVITVTGKVVIASTASAVEIQIQQAEVIVPVTASLPFEIYKKDLEVRLDTLLDHRLLALKNLRTRAIFKGQAQILHYMREYFAMLDFTEMNTPKLIGYPTEGGAEVFEVKYYERSAYLAQSPQFYKQMMVSVFERVYEIAHAYRAEKSNTSRHMAELIMIDAEMGFIESWRDVSSVAAGLLRYVIEQFWQKESAILALWPELTKPVIPEVVPEVTVAELHQLYFKATGEDVRSEPDPSPAEERFICTYMKEQTGSDAVLITEFPSSVAKFYHYINPDKPAVADRADLLFKGVEVATISRRITNYETLLESCRQQGIDTSNPGLKDYLQAFAYGMPAEGGFGMGLERITQKLFDLSNVKEASLFPRDVQRIAP